jgi:hypothetical protein
MIFSSKTFRLALVSTAILNFVVNVSPAFAMDPPPFSQAEKTCALVSHSSTFASLDDEKFYELHDFYRALAKKGDNEAIGKLALLYAYNPDRPYSVYYGERYAMTAISQGIQDGLLALRETFTTRYNRSGKLYYHKYFDDLAQYCNTWLIGFGKNESEQVKRISIRAWAYSKLFPLLENEGWEPQSIVKEHSKFFSGVEADYL